MAAFEPIRAMRFANAYRVARRFELMFFGVSSSRETQTVVPDCCKSHHRMTMIRFGDWSPVALGYRDNGGANAEATRVS